MADFDVIVIGGGPGGYVAAIRCSQLGLKTACVDERLDEQGRPSLGGVCLNVGCIPSKALLDSSHHYHRAQHEFADHGIGFKGLDMDLATMMARKHKVVKILTDGIAMLFMKHKISWLQGRGVLAGDRRVRVSGSGEAEKEYTAENIIIATGSSPQMPEVIPVDEKIVDSTGALSFDTVPKRLAVIGGGVIGLELGSVWSRLGAKVSVLVRGDRFLKNVDQQLAHEVQKDLQQQGIDIQLGAKLVSVKPGKKTVTLNYATPEGESKLTVDRVLVATGRQPNTTHIGAEVVGLNLDGRGFIAVDEQCRTNLPNVFAIGDVVRGPMLAHKASEEGVAVAERIAGQQPEVNYALIPSVVYTWPELAWVGQTSEQCQATGIAFNTGVFPFAASGRAHAAGDTHGLVKILSDAHSDQILGVHIYGPNASELISEAVVAMEFAASAEDLARIVHAHPTLSEAVHEAALAVDGRSLHS
ncbi:MAG TPA: dihydrolipoyl dehydrogenase [Gammaproteobacteria bacterium]|nr:dihydrolipoyl dehydrogenase [Gammaproteobacteria bacterium]